MKEQGRRKRIWMAAAVVILLVFAMKGKTAMAASITAKVDEATGRLTVKGSGVLTKLSGVSAYDKQSVVTSIEVSGNFTKVDPYVFSGYHRVRSITLPDTITEIGNYAFDSCYQLEYIRLPKSLNSIGSYCFQLCRQLQKLNLPSGLKKMGSNAFFRSGVKQVTFAEGTTQIPEDAFNTEGIQLEQVNLPSSVKSIGKYAFSNCESLSKIFLPTGLTSIGQGSFRNCISLKRMVIPATVTSVGEAAFDDAGIQELYFAKGTTTILEYIIYGNQNLRKVELPDSVTSIESYAFYGCSNLSELSLPKNLKSMGSSVFYGCFSLKKLTIPKTFTLEKSFLNGTGIEEVTFENGIKKIPAQICRDAHSLKKVNIPNTVEEIGRSAFYQCNSLQTVTLPKGLKSIDQFAFMGCSSLKTIDIPSEIATVKENSFDQYTDLVIYGVSHSPVERLCSQNEGWHYSCKYKKVSYLTISVAATAEHTGRTLQPSVVVKDGNRVLTKNKDYTLSYRNNKNLGQASIVVTGKGSKYYGSTSKRFVIIPARNEVYTYGNLRYRITNAGISGNGCVSVVGLVKASKSVIIPAKVKIAGYTYKVTGIEKKAFYKQSKVKKVTIQSTQITSFGKKAFSGINKKAVIHIPKKNYKSYSKLIKKSGITKTIKIKK